MREKGQMTTQQHSRQISEHEGTPQEMQMLQASIPGKLEVLLHKVDKIEESQSMILRKVDGLHTAIYDPDTGLFSRIKESAMAAATRDVELDQKTRMSADRLEELAKDVTADAERHKQIDASMAKVEDLVRWRLTALRVVKYVGLALLTSVGGFLAKVVYDWITGHVRLI